MRFPFPPTSWKRRSSGTGTGTRRSLADSGTRPRARSRSTSRRPMSSRRRPSSPAGARTARGASRSSPPRSRPPRQGPPAARSRSSAPPTPGTRAARAQTARRPGEGTARQYAALHSGKLTSKQPGAGLARGRHGRGELHAPRAGAVPPRPRRLVRVAACDGQDRAAVRQSLSAGRIVGEWGYAPSPRCASRSSATTPGAASSPMSRSGCSVSASAGPRRSRRPALRGCSSRSCSRGP